MPAQKKDPSVRARRNRAAGAATLSTPSAKAKAPPLPRHPSGKAWHAQARKFWEDVWASPMSPEWDPASDHHNVLMCTMLMHDIWTAPTAAVRAKVAGEFRLQRASLGLSPYDRRRLEWTIEQADEAKDKGTTRRAARKAPAKKTTPAPADPRAHLHAVPS